MKAIFILGTGHCGSTLLELLLGSHSHIVSLGEIVSLRYDNICSCGEKSEDCEFWGKLLGKGLKDKVKIHRKKLDMFLGRKRFFVLDRDYKPTLIDEENRDDILGANEYIFNEARKKFGDKILVDSSKDANRAIFLAQSKNIEPIFIHIFRDGRAVTWSYYRKYEKFFSYAWRWLAENLKPFIVAKRNSHIKYIKVRYKDLAQNPEEVLRRITGELGLEYEPEMLKFRDQVQHQLGGNRMKLKQGNEIKFDEKWRRMMPLKIKILFNGLFGWINLFFIYLIKKK